MCRQRGGHGALYDTTPQNPGRLINVTGSAEQVAMSACLRVRCQVVKVVGIDQNFTGHST